MAAMGQQMAWRRAPYGVCGLVSCASCEYFQAGLCPGCVRGNAVAARKHRDLCAIYRCVKSQGAESCRECRAESCPVLESGRAVECGLISHFAGERGGTSLADALMDLRSVRQAHPCADLPPRLLRRLPSYLAALHELTQEGIDYVVSGELARRVGISPALVRKDLSTLGHWGRRSAGYRVGWLADNLRRAVGLSEMRRAAWLGCEGLARHRGLMEQFRYAGCAVTAVFCEDGAHVGAQCEGLRVRPLAELAQAAQDLKLQVAILAVDDARAQAAADFAAGAGLRSILNLTNKILVQPRGAILENLSPLQGLVSLLLRSPAPSGPTPSGVASP